MIRSFSCIYGPVYSWRLGTSLGVDPLSGKQKICNMNCSYCQLGRTVSPTHDRQVYVPTQTVIDEIATLPHFFVDYITFSGRGEPTLAKNLGEMIRAVKKIRREKVAVITNSLLMHDVNVQDDLMAADFVLAKLDAADNEMFKCVDGVCGIDLDMVVKGMAQFRDQFKGKFALQIMMVKDNAHQAQQLGTLAYFLNPHEVQLNTPLRACGQTPLSLNELNGLKKHFKGMPVISCYDAPNDQIEPMDEHETSRRHGVERKDRYVY